MCLNAKNLEGKPIVDINGPKERNKKNCKKSIDQHLARVRNTTETRSHAV